MSLKIFKEKITGRQFGAKGFLGLLVLLVFAGCSTGKESIKKDAVLMNEANREFAKRDFIQAEEAYKKIIDNYPESPYRVNALMGYADTLFKQENYLEAEWNYREFYELYPVHTDTEKSYFYSGMSHFNEMVKPDRDQTPTRKALEEFEKIANDPAKSSSPFYRVAQEKIRVCKERLARRVFQIGKFYFRTREYLSAITRLKEFMEEHPGLSYENEAVYMIGESYFMKDNFAEAGKFFSHLIKNYSSDAKTIAAKRRLALIEAAGERLSWN